MIEHIFNRKIVFVTGKGGVGKTTVTAALALAAVRTGKRPLIYQFDSPQQLTDLNLSGELLIHSADNKATLRQWLGEQLKIGRLADFVAGSNSFRQLFNTAPGASEILNWREIIELSHSKLHDLVIIDAPASGHALGMLKAPSSYLAMTRTGPLHKQIKQIEQIVSDPEQTAVVAVTHAAELPVNETLELQTKLRDELQLELAAVLVNGLYEPRFGRAGKKLDEFSRSAATPITEAALKAGRSYRQRELCQRRELNRLKDALEAPSITLPFIFQDRLDSDAIEQLASSVNS